MRRSTIVFLISGSAHLPYLVVSLRSLRRFYGGRVVVYVYPESEGLVREIAKDTRLDIQVVLWEPRYRGKNGQFTQKILVMQQLDVGVALYLDADTMPMCDPEPLLELGSRVGFCATQFCDWKSNNGKAANRIRGLLGREGIDRESVEYVLNNPLPSVNGGVFACRPSSLVLPTWHEWTMACRDMFIADETVLHAMMGVYANPAQPMHPDAECQMIVAEGGAWNCSPKFQPVDLADKDVAIWHFHGDSCVRPTKSQKGYNLWWPVFESCCDMNIGSIRDWLPQIENRFLKECLDTKTGAVR